MKKSLGILTVAALVMSLSSVALAATTPTTNTSWVVKPGDTLWKIRQATGVSVPNLEQFNPSVSPENLSIGSVLNLSTPFVGRTYTVAAGDSLWLISQKTGVSLQALIAANQIQDPNILASGQVLQIPSKVATYVVVAGDALWKIAQRTGVSVQNIVQANDLSNPDQIYVGEVLIIPTASDAVSSAATQGGAAGTETTSYTGPAIGTVTLTGAHGSTTVNDPVHLAISVTAKQGSTTLTVPNNDISYRITGANEVSNSANAAIDPALQTFVAGRPGIYTCVATIDGVQSPPLSIQVFGPPSSVVVTDNPYLVSGSRVWLPFKVTVSDAIGQPVNAQVVFTVNNPEIAQLSASDPQGQSNQQGQTSVTTSTYGSGNAWVWIRAGAASGPTDITIDCSGIVMSIPLHSGTGPAAITLSAGQTSLVANTNFTDVITIHAVNSDSSPTAGLTMRPQVSSTLFNPSAYSVVTDSQGNAHMTLFETQSGTSGASNLGSGTGYVFVTAGTQHAQLAIPVLPGVDASNSSWSGLDPAITGSGGQTTVQVADASRNPVEHLTAAAFDVQYLSASGWQHAVTGVHEIGNGQYQVTVASENGLSAPILAVLYVNGVKVGSAVPVGTQGSSPTGSSASTVAAHISITQAGTLTVGASTSTTVQIKVTDAQGNPVANTPILLTLSNENVATVTNQVVTTDASGTATLDLSPGSMAGNALLTAISGDVTQTLPLVSLNQ